MKISFKIFIFTYCIMMCITVLAGFYLLDYMYQDDMDKAIKHALDNNEILYTYVATLEETPDDSYVEYSLAGIAQKISSDNKNNKVFLGSRDEWREQIILEDYYDLDNGQVVSCIIETEEGMFVQVTSRYNDRYIINYYDLVDEITQRDNNYNIFKKMIIIASMLIAVILYVFSRHVTTPLSKVTAIAEKLSDGDYSARVPAVYKNMKSYEVMSLGETLNHLAINTEKHISELEEIAQKREDFVGNFTHEIKTPLTAIIGYADLLRTYDLEPEKRREYSNFIYNEGKRLEQLSLNLLQLIVIGRADFTLIEMNTGALFSKIKDSVHFSGEKYNVRFEFRYEEARVIAETSLIIAAVINLIDNACKASKPNQIITVVGEVTDAGYVISVSDKGRGIPKEEIGKIMEPFYMVDKSRARSQGGAGLGLALCRKIAELHKGNIFIESELGKGTTVKLVINCAKEGDLYEE